jgi:MFS family permease
VLSGRRSYPENRAYERLATSRCRSSPSIVGPLCLTLSLMADASGPEGADPTNPLPVPLPTADSGAQSIAEALEEPLVSERPAAIGALLVSTTLLRTGTVAAGASVAFYFGFHSPAYWAGVVGAVQGLSEAISAPILARFADRVGRKRFLIGGPLIGGLGALLLVWASHPRHFALARVLEGVGAGAFVPTALGTIAAASAHNPTVRAKASSAFEGANLLGYAVGFALAGLLWRQFNSTTFFFVAGFYVAAAMICAAFVPHIPALPVSPISKIVKAITGPGPIRSFLPAWMCAFALIGAYGTNLPALMKTTSRLPRNASQILVHRLDSPVIGAVLTSWIIILVIGIVLWLPVLTRVGAVNTMRRAVPGAWIISAGLLALNHTTLSAAPIFLPIISLGVLLLAGFGPAAVTYLAECSETFAADRSALMSFYTVTLSVGGALGALAGAAWGAWLQVDGLIIFGLLLSLAAFIALRPVANYERALSKAIDE